MVDPTDINSKIATQLPTNTTGKITAAVLISALTVGGVGAGSGITAWTVANFAGNGANADITSLSGLTTPLSLPQGGCGATTALGCRTTIGAAASPVPPEQGGVASVTEPAFGWVGDGQSAVATWAAGSPAVAGVTGKPGQMFAAPGVGVGGGPFQTTFATPNTLTAAPTYSSGSWYADGEVCPVAAAGNGSGVAPNDTFTVTGAGFNAPTNCIAISTGVYGAAVAAAGSGASTTSLTCIVTGTTGNVTGVKFAALVNMNGSGGIASVVGTYYPGQYFGAGGNPTDITQEPVVSAGTGCSTLTGAKLSLTMGVNRAWMTQRGNASAQPAATQTPSNVIGSGAGVVFALPYVQSGQAWWGTDNQTAIANFAATAAAGSYRVPAGTYLSSCPAAALAWPLTNAVSLYGDPGSSVIQLSPWCVQQTASALFIYNSLSHFRWRDITLDFNNATTTTAGFPYYNSMTRNVIAGVLVEGNGQDATFDDANFINMRSGQIGLQVFEPVGLAFDHLTYQNSRCTENTRVGPINHCFYATHAIGGNLTNISFINNVSVGSNIAIQASNGLVQNNDVCCQGYGGAINIAPAPTLPAFYVDMKDNWLHDANNGVEDGDGDIPSGTESYDFGGLFEGNHIWNEPGPGIKICAEHNQIKNNFLWDNGGATGPNQASGSVRWQFNAGIMLLRLFGAAACDSNGALITGNHAWDTYTFALANGYSTAGLASTQFFGLSESGLSSGDLARIFADNDFGYNSNGFALTVGVAQIARNGSGTGYGATVTGTMTWAGAGCSTAPVLNVKTTGTGLISVVNSIANPGVCTVLPASTDASWTPGGGLSAGSGALFALTAPLNTAGTIFGNGFETIDLITQQSQQSITSYNWGEASIGAGVTDYFYASQTVEANRTLFSPVNYAGAFRKLNVSVVTAAVTAPVVVTFYTGATAGAAAAGPLTCSILVGATSCTADIPQPVPANSFMVVQLANGSSSSTGQISLSFELWRTQ